MAIPKFAQDFLAALEDKYIGTIVSLFLVLYGGLARPELPKFVKDLLANDLLRVLYVFLLAYLADKNVQVALVCAVVFMVLNGLWADSEVQEAFDNLEMETYGDDEDDEVDVDSPPNDDEDTFEGYEDVDDEIDELYADDDEEDVESPSDDIDA